MLDSTRFPVFCSVGLRFVIALILGLGAFAKIYQLWDVADLDQLVFRSRLVTFLLIGLELVLVFELIVFWDPRQVIRISQLTISIFCIYNLVAIWRGQDQCGCLGAVSFSPAIMLGIDVGILIGLFALDKYSFACLTKKRNTLFRYAGQFVLVLSLLFIVFPADATSESAGSGGRRLLTPANWIGELLPIIEDIELSRSLASFERFDLVLVRSQCAKCSEALNTVFQQYSGDPVLTIVVDINHQKPLEVNGNDIDGPAIIWANLKAQSDWTVDVPCWITVKNGKVEKVSHKFSQKSE